MTRLRRRVARDERGGAVIEFALVLPILVGLLLYGANAWLQLSHANDMSTALHTGARYYQDGGSDDATAKVLAMSAWPRTPADAALSVARACMCGSNVVTCSTICGGDPPEVLVTLSAQSTFNGLVGSALLTQQETVRVR